VCRKNLCVSVPYLFDVGVAGSFTLFICGDSSL
jgi:hypothetical protein